MNNPQYPLTWEQIAAKDSRIRPGRGGDVKIWCPFCRPTARDKEGKPLSVNLTTGLFNCHDDSCQAHGIVTHEGDNETDYTTRDIVTHKVDWAEPDMRNIKPASERVIAYMESRGISRQTMEYGFVRSYVNLDGAEEVAFVYPERGGAGKPVNYKRRSIDPNVPKGSRFRSSIGTYKPPYLFRHLSAHPETIYICEAEIDALSLVEAGLRDVVAMPSGGSEKGMGKKLDFLDDMMDEIRGARKVIICTDNDDAGKKTAEEVARRVGFDKSGVVEFPAGIKDANEFLVKFGPDRLRSLVQRPVIATVDGVSSIYDFADELWDVRFTDDDEIGYRAAGFPLLSDHFRIAPGSFVVVTGLPEAGKSSFMRAFLMSVAGSNDDVSIAFCAPEDSVIRRDFFRQFVLLVSGKKPSEFESRDDYDMIVEMIGEKIILLHPEQNSLESILTRAEYAVERYGVKAVVIDPWTEVEAERIKGEDPQEYLSRCLVRAQHIARNRGITMIIIAHPTKEAQIRSRNSGIAPLLEEISGSAIWRNKAAVGISLHRNVDDPAALTTVEIVKVRNARVAKRGKIFLTFDPLTGRFMETGVVETNSPPKIEQKVVSFRQSEFA